MNRRLFFSLTAAILAPLTGCSDYSAKSTVPGVASGGGPSVGGPMLVGTVNYQGKPLGYGVLTIQAESGKVYRAIVKTDGTYRLALPPPGTYKVGVDTTNVPMGASMGGPGGKGPPKRIYLPEKLKDPQTSGITIQVVENMSTLDFTIPDTGETSEPSKESKEPSKESKEPKKESKEPKKDK